MADGHAVSADTRPLAIALMGPTASGKTALAIDWARRFDGEIVSVDSALVYRGLDIGAAKPDPSERASVPHHMLDLRDPWQPYSAAEFAADAATRGWAALHAELAAIDPQAGLRIHATDAQRIQRALEVYRVSGQPISHWQGMRGHDRLSLRVLKLAVSPRDRGVLHARIERRFDTMLAAGFLDEVRRLRSLPQLQSHPAPLGLPALRAVGYRQAWEHQDGQATAAEFRDRAIFATRQLAKRQLTWLRGELDMRWFDPAHDRLELDQAMGLFLGNPLR
jgi:tRNA dimethylallyltransferase